MKGSVSVSWHRRDGDGFSLPGQAFIFLDNRKPWSKVKGMRIGYGTDLFVSGTEVRIFLIGFLGRLGKVELLGRVGPSPPNEIGAVELPCGTG